MFSTKVEVRVRYCETDQMQFLWHGNYLQYFEMGRTELLRVTGLSYKGLEDAGFYLPLIDAHLNFKSPGKYDEVLQITSSMAEIPKSRMRIDYAVVEKESNRLLCTGYTTHCFMRKSDNKVTRVPEIFVKHISPFFNQ